jgi:hypothetical protein
VKLLSTDWFSLAGSILNFDPTLLLICIK